MDWMTFIKEYQSLIGVFFAIVAMWKFMYVPMMMLVEANTSRIERIEDKIY